MAPQIDSAIIKALGLKGTSTTMSRHGGSGFSSTFKITSTGEDGREKAYFVKTGQGKESEVMFAGSGEHMSLNAIHDIVPTLCPRSFGHGRLADSSESAGGAWLATDFLHLSSTSSSSSSSSLAQKLAQLHSTPAPPPPSMEIRTPQFGFPSPTCCGSTVQSNTWESSWAKFYADHRLRHILSSAEERHGRDAELASLVETTAAKVVPRLLRDGHLTTPQGGPIVPVVVHGDLWSGNWGRGWIGGDGEGEGKPAPEVVVFDPSSCYAHSEFEFGIMRMFGGFGRGFEKEYHAIKPKDEPADEWEDRVKLYELYHHLNHYSIFGGGYKSGATGIMRGLIAKYADGDK